MRIDIIICKIEGSILFRIEFLEIFNHNITTEDLSNQKPVPSNLIEKETNPLNLTFFLFVIIFNIYLYNQFKNSTILIFIDNKKT